MMATHRIQIGLDGQHVWFAGDTDDWARPDVCADEGTAWKANEEVANIKADLLRPCFPDLVTIEVVPIEPLP